MPLIDISIYLNNLFKNISPAYFSFKHAYNCYEYLNNEINSLWKFKVTRPIMFINTFNLKFYYYNEYTHTFNKKSDEIIKFKVDEKYNITILKISNNNRAIDKSLLKLYKDNSLKLK